MDFVVFEIAGEFGLDPKVFEQHAAVTGIFRRDDVDAIEDVVRPQRQVAQVSERRGNHI